MKIIWLALYYGMARNLPKSSFPIIGKYFLWLRVLCAKHIFKYVGKNVNIEHGAWFGKGQGIEIGDYSGIGINCYVPNDIKIGKYVMMGPKCHFMDNSFHISSSVNKPMYFQGMCRKEGRTIIGDDVWIGYQCIVTPCKYIGDHSIVGGGSLVSKDVPEFAVVGGNPIKIIRLRK